MKVDLIFSGQADDLLFHLPAINRDDIVHWFVHKRRISIGGGDVLEYLKYKKSQIGTKK